MASCGYSGSTRRINAGTFSWPPTRIGPRGCADGGGGGGGGGGTTSGVPATKPGYGPPGTPPSTPAKRPSSPSLTTTGSGATIDGASEGAMSWPGLGAGAAGVGAALGTGAGGGGGGGGGGVATNAIIVGISGSRSL